jgi:hypothetical protein
MVPAKLPLGSMTHNIAGFQGQGAIARQHFKDARLNELAELGNVAQFVSFGPDGVQRFGRIAGLAPNEALESTASALGLLIERSGERRINLRSFRPDQPQGNEFVYGINTTDEAETAVFRLIRQGLFVIANETIDVNDGGVSGVAQGGAIEFAPGATPRVVETARVTGLPLNIGLTVLRSVYGFDLEIPLPPDWRVEFSIHPVCRGFRHMHSVLWEAEKAPGTNLTLSPRWPNSFSQFIGDKVFGLLLAESIGLSVPRTTAICRGVAPFSFGQSTSSEVKWLRTCPRLPEPGLYPTVRGWTDPFHLMASDTGDRIAAVLVQEEVPATFAGAMLTDRRGSPIIEGVHGFGDQLMLGRAHPIALPAHLLGMLEELHRAAFDACGSVRIEWGFDGRRVWVFQLQQEAATSAGLVVVPGEVDTEVDFMVSDGLEGLRELVEQLVGTRTGIRLVGSIGITSHIADVLRRHKIPSRILPLRQEDHAEQ